jgi:hypothetical protein
MAHVVGHGVVIRFAFRAGRRRFRVDVTRGRVIHMSGLKRCPRVGDADSRLVRNTNVPGCGLSSAMEAAGFDLPRQALRTGNGFVEGDARRAGPGIHGNLLNSGQSTEALLDCRKIQNAEEIADV